VTGGVALPEVAPELAGDQVLLSTWTEADLPRLVELADETSRTWSRSLAAVRTVDDARRWLAGRVGPGRVDWVVRDPRSGLLVGRVALHHFHEQLPVADVGYGVHPAHRRRGVARAAVDRAARYGFDVLGLVRLQLLHDVRNTASCGVAARAGFAFEGLERQALDYPDGSFGDQHRHARLASDPAGPVDAGPVPLEVPVLEADGLRLRPWRAEDAPVYLRGLADREAARWNPSGPPATEDDARRLIARMHRRALDGTGIAWAVEVDGAVTGAVALRGVNLVDRWVNAAYWVLPEARGRGIAARALRVATSYAFEALDLHRVQLQHAVANTASCRVAEKAGFVLEAVQHESCLLAEGFVDEHQHVRLRGR
jgi:RimJ/RimL family protein N-acetyltransferase